MREKRPMQSTAGEVLVTERTFVSNKINAGIGAFGRVGLLFLRTHPFSLMLTADYHVAVAEVHRNSTHQALIVNLNLIMGGSK